MLNSRSIPNELWAKARERLIFFFSRRLGIQNSEDLAHNTLLAIWTREDYVFAREEDFLRVCLGFARKILLEGYSEDAKRRGWVELDPEFEEKIFGVKGLHGPEVSVFLAEVMRYAQENLDTEEWALIQRAVNANKDSAPTPGQIRTQVHRIRKKLAKTIGWDKSEV